MVCTSEFVFEGLFTDIEVLKLIDCFISPDKLASKFPNLKHITIRGIYRREQCALLGNTAYRTTGCSQGKLFTAQKYTNMSCPVK